MDVDDAGVDALSGQLLCRQTGFVDHQAGGDDGDVVALGELLALAQLEVVVGLIVEDGHCQTAEAQVDRALHRIRGADGCAGLDVIGGADDGHAGQAAHQGEILAALVGSAVLTDGDAAVGRADLNVQAGVSDGVADLLKGTARSKHGKAGNERGIAHGGQARSHAHHVALGNAAVKVAVRICLAEHAGLGGGGQVGVQHHDVVVTLCSQLLQGVAVAVTGRNLLHICHLTFPPLPARRRLRSVPSWRSHIPRHWGPCRASQRRSP